MAQMVYIPIQRLTNGEGKHVCRIPIAGVECYFLIAARGENPPACKYVLREIFNDKPHPMCPIRVGSGFAEKTV